MREGTSAVAMDAEEEEWCSEVRSSADGRLLNQVHIDIARNQGPYDHSDHDDTIADTAIAGAASPRCTAETVPVTKPRLFCGIYSMEKYHNTAIQVIFIVIL